MKKCDTQKRLILPADMQQNQQIKKMAFITKRHNRNRTKDIQ